MINGVSYCRLPLELDRPLEERALLLERPPPEDTLAGAL